jgi:hypothetical protein
LGLLPLPAISQVFALARLRNEQKGMAEFVGLSFTADSWGFGQIAALLVWAPILIEPFCAWMGNRRIYLESGNEKG